jgi:hypothetical protein
MNNEERTDTLTNKLREVMVKAFGYFNAEELEFIAMYVDVKGTMLEAWELAQEDAGI